MLATWKGSTGSTVSKTIGYLNKSGQLSQPITYTEVAGPLAALGDQAAEKLLQELAESGPMVRDPTAWLKSAAQKWSKGAGGPKGSAWGGGKGGSAWGGKGGSAWGGKGGSAWGGKGGSPWGGKGVSDWGGSGGYFEMDLSFLGGKGGGKGGDSWFEVSPWIRKQVGWLNKSKKLATPITFNDVAGPLSMCGDDRAIALLKELEENASTVKDPTAWLSSAANKACWGGGKWLKGSGLSKRIGELNKSKKLVDAVIFRDVVGPLSCMDESQANALIDELEQNGSAIKNPTNWLKSAAERGIKRRKMEASAN